MTALAGRWWRERKRLRAAPQASHTSRRRRPERQGQRHGRQSGRGGEVGKQVVGDDGDPQQDHLGVDKLHEKPGEKISFPRVPPLRVLAVQALPCLIEHVGGAHQPHQRLKEGEGVVKDLGEGQAQQHDGAQPAQHPQVQPDSPAKALPPPLLQSIRVLGPGVAKDTRQ